MGAFRRNSIWQLLQSVSSTGTDLLILLAFSAKLGTTEFGQLTVLLSFAKIISLVFEPRIHEYLIPRLVRALHRTRLGVWVYIRIGLAIELGGNVMALLICMLLYFLTPAILNAQAGDSALFPFIVLFVITSTLLKYSSISVFRALGEVKKSAIIAMFVGVIKLGLLGMALFAMDCSATSSLLLLSAIGLGSALLQTIIALGTLRSRCGEPPDYSANQLRVENVRRTARQVFGNYSMGLLEIAHRELDMQLLAALTTAKEAGSYRIAKNLALILMELLNPIVMMLLPEFSQRVSNRNWPSVVEFICRAALVLSCLAACTGFVMYFSMPMLIQQFLPAQVASIQTFKLVLVGLIVSTPLLWAQSLLVSLANSYHYLVASAIGATMALVAAVLLIPSYGANGSAIAFGGGLLITSSIAAYMAVVVVRQARGKSCC